MIAKGRALRPSRRRTMTARAVVGALALAAVLIGNASAQQAPPPQAPSSADAPPVAVGPDWRHEKRGADVHTFYCQQALCMPPSAVSYRLYAPDNTMTLERFRHEQEEILGALEQRAAPGTRIKILEIKGDEGSGPRRMFVVRRLTEHPNGTKEFRVSSTLLGVNHLATVISTSQDEQAAIDNHSVFVLAVMLFINLPPIASYETR